MNHELQIQMGTFTSSIWDILGANRQVFTPLHSNASSHFDWHQILYQRSYCITRKRYCVTRKRHIFDKIFDTARIRFETQTNMYVRSRITISIWDILVANRQVFTPLHSNVSSHFDWYQTHSKEISFIYIL